MTRIDWHAAFVPAMKLELRADEANLVFDEEHCVDDRKYRIDLVVIKILKDILVSRDIGSIFGVTVIREN